MFHARTDVGEDAVVRDVHSERAAEVAAQVYDGPSADGPTVSARATDCALRNEPNAVRKATPRPNPTRASRSRPRPPLSVA